MSMQQRQHELSRRQTNYQQRRDKRKQVDPSCSSEMSHTIPILSFQYSTYGFKMKEDQVMHICQILSLASLRQ